MDYYNITQEIKAEALKLGFAFCGIAMAEPLEKQREFYTDFIKQKKHGQFHYLKTNLEKRLDPKLLLPEAKSVIALLLNYYPTEIIPEKDNYIMAKYAYGKDYPPVLNEKMKELIHFIKAKYPGLKARSFVDSGPVMEKTWAQKSGLGWQGKNTLLINKSSGSFFFIGIILTNLELDPDPPEKDHCGECMECINACPTGALSQPYQLDISHCISSLTIEIKNGIPEDLKDKFRDRIYGCDICQDVCPFNSFAKPHNEPAFLSAEKLTGMRKEDWKGLSEADFNQIFKDSAVERTGYKNLIRTIRTLSSD